MTDEQYVQGWERERDHQGGMRGGLPPRLTRIPEAPIHAVEKGGRVSVCGVALPHVDDEQPWVSGGRGRCRDCRAKLVG